MGVSFHEIRLPEGISYGVTGGPEYAVDIATTKAGLEQRNLSRDEGRCKYNAAYGVKNKMYYEILLIFFRARKGRTYGFRFKDWFDFKAVNQLIGHGTVGRNSFQLIKSYADDAGIDIRKIVKPVKGTLIIYVDGVFTSKFTCDYTKGIVTIPDLTGTPDNPNIITADFEFDVPVRFDIVQMVSSYDDFNNLGWPNIPLIELIGE